MKNILNDARFGTALSALAVVVSVINYIIVKVNMYDELWAILLLVFVVVVMIANVAVLIVQKKRNSVMDSDVENTTKQDNKDDIR